MSERSSILATVLFASSFLATGVRRRTTWYVVDDGCPAPRAKQRDIRVENPYNTEVTDERGGISQYAFDGAGRLVAIIDPLGRTVAQHSWTSQFRLQTTENVLGGTTTIQYDGKGDPV